MNVDLSILIPTCSRLDAVQECLRGLRLALSVASGTRCEVILGNDGPPEDPDRILLTDYPCPVRISQGPRKGPAANRNHLALQAKGDVLLFLDDDVKPSQNLITAYVKAFRMYPEAGIFEGRIESEARPRFAYDEVIQNETGGHLLTANLAVRSEVFERLSGFDADFPFASMEDTDFRFRSQAAGVIAQWCPEASVSHPVVTRKGSLYFAKRRYSLLLFVNKHPEYLEVIKTGFTYRAWIRLVKHNLLRRSLFQPIDGYLNLLHSIHNVTLTRRCLRAPSNIPMELIRMEAAMNICASTAKRQEDMKA